MTVVITSSIDRLGPVGRALAVVVIPGPPCAQGRGQAVRVGQHVRVIDPKKSRSWKGAAQVHMAVAMQGRMSDQASGSPA